MDERWVLVEATDADIDELMTWLGTADDVVIWGGPTFRFPFTPESFREDCHWGKMMSFSLRDVDNLQAGFGQIYDRNGRINLARLIVHPARRGRGIGRRLVEMLMAVGPGLLTMPEFSLFVFRNNEAALRCYISLGFEISDYPDDQILADQCYFLTRPVEDGCREKER